MGVIADLALRVAPQWAAKRERAKLVAMHYRAARLGTRSDSLMPSRASADRAGDQRERIAAYTRDLIRNTPYAKRGQMVIANNVVGDGILPKIELQGRISDEAKAALREAGMRMIEAHLDTTAIDTAGLLNLYGLQRLAMNTIFDSGEVLIRRHRRRGAGGVIDLQIEVLEPDFLDTGLWRSTDEGGQIRDGIEYDATGQRVAFWLFRDHPGDYASLRSLGTRSERVPTEDILHIFSLDRPGQSRGISWLSPVAEKLMSFDDYEDAQMMRQKIAACFTAFRRLGSSEVAEKVALDGKLEPGVIMDIGADDEMEFASPPEVGGYDEFTRQILRSVAMGLGITYEALTGDLTGVNFSSARIGRLEMDRCISSWQWLMLIPMMMQPLGGWILDAWREEEPLLWQIPEDRAQLKLAWVPPVRILVDPATEISAFNEAVRAGFESRQSVVRQFGKDPERLAQEQEQDKAEADRLGLLFDSDPRADAARHSRNNQSPRKEDGHGPKAALDRHDRP